MANSSSGSGKIPWKLIMWVALYAFVAYAYPPLRPANIAHSLALFAQGIQAGQQG
jgi:hypothetical protein